MPNPTRTWTADADVAFSNQSDQDVQFQEAIYQVKEIVRLAGGGASNVRSSDGTTASDADNWTSAAALGLGAAGTGAWYTAQLGAQPGGSTVYVLLYINDTTGNPQQYGIRIATAAYTGGNTTTLPTTAGTETVMNVSGDDLIPWSTVVAGRMAWGYTTLGDFWMAIKEEGESFFRQGLLFEVFTDTEGGGKGAYRFGLWTSSQAAAAAWTLTAFSSSANWEGIHPSGTSDTACEAHTTISNITGWTNGLDYLGQLQDDVFNLYTDASAAGGARFIGQHPDVQATETSVAWGSLDDSETAQTYRRTVMGDGSGVIMYLPTAAFPLT